MYKRSWSSLQIRQKLLSRKCKDPKTKTGAAKKEKKKKKKKAEKKAEQKAEKKKAKKTKRGKYKMFILQFTNISVSIYKMSKDKDR